MEQKGFQATQEATCAATTWGGKAKGSPTTKTYTQLAGPGGKVYLVEEGELGKLQTLSSADVPGTTATPFAGLATDNPSASTTTNDVEWEG